MIEKGPNLKNLALAVGVMFFGVGLIGAGALFDFTLAIGSAALPGWSIFVLGGIALLVGCVLAAMSLNAEKCGQCATHLDYGEAYFPLELEAQVLQAASQVDGSPLAQASMVPKGQMKMALEMDFCPECGQVGRLGVTKWQDYESHKLMEARVVSGPGAAALAQIVQAHVSARGEDDD